MRCIVLLLSLHGPLLPGCAETSFDGDVGDGSLDAGRADLAVYEAYVFPDGLEIGKAKVFVHTEDSLFEVDPLSLAITPVAAFGWPANTDIPKMTDIALDKNGKMIGVSKTTIYAVDPETAACTRLATLPSTQYHFVGLSYVVDPTSLDASEYLMGLDKEGAVYEVNPATGNVKHRGTLGGGLRAGGDVVSVKGFGTVATVEKKDDDTDWLAQVDPGSGAATLIGDTGFSKVFGLGYWKDKVYGFAAGGEFVLIDVKTGGGALQKKHAHAWWGAGVTTVAPVIE